MTTPTARSISAQLEANAATYGGSVWLRSPDTGATVTWAEAQAAARSIASHLDAMGLAPGAPVAVAAQLHLVDLMLCRDHLRRLSGDAVEPGVRCPGAYPM